MNFRSLFKKMTSVLVMLAIIAAILPTSVFAAAEENTVTVYLSVSDDGDFFTSPVTGEKIARIPVEISYFDLADYGLETYYRYETEGGSGTYINTNVVECPTLLHLLIKATERYYIGGDYTVDNTEAMNISGAATSMFLMNFWGHDYNIMMYTDHAYPEMSEGLGATADYILLENGMDIQIGMFTGMDYYTNGYFSHFENGGELTAAVGDTVELAVLGVSTNTWGGPVESEQLGSELVTVFYGTDPDCLYNGTMVEDVDGDGKFSVTFDTAGTYYAAAYDNAVGSGTSTIVPAFTKIIVTEPEKKLPDNALEIGAETGNGSLDYVFFTDAQGNAVDGLEAYIEDKNITVMLPESFDASETVRAEFSLTQNADGYPFVTPSTATSGVSSNQAFGARKNIYDTVLARGTGSVNVYFYNQKPTSWRDNVYDTYKITYTVKNDAPVLADGIEPNVIKELSAGEEYSLSPDTVFYDANGDELEYFVTLNGDEKTLAGNVYSIAPMLGGEYTLVFTADDGKTESEETYTVTLDVKNSDVTYDMTVGIPEGITPSFYITKGFDDEGYDIAGDALCFAAGETEEGFVIHTVSVPVNIDRISVRAENADGEKLGGMSVESATGDDVSFREVHGFIPNKAYGEYVTADEALFAVADKQGNYAVPGINGTDADGILYYTFFLAATGNDSQYTFYARPVGDMTSSFAETRADNKIVPAGDSTVYENAVEMSYNKTFGITAPRDAEVEMYRQIRNFNTVELEVFDIADDGGDTVTYVYSIPSDSGSHSYRVSMDGKITKAGYVSGNSIEVSWDDDDPVPSDRIYYDTSTTFGSRGDDSLLMNVGGTGNIVMADGETFRLRAYRIWQIINSDTQNKMIEPDFNYETVSGEDIIDIVPVESGSGNAKSNWLDITAVGTGTAIIEIGYDAIDILSGNQTNRGGAAGLDSFTYGAVDPARTGLVVIQTENAALDIDFGIRCFSRIGGLTADSGSAADWDAEYDTLYFSGDYATLKFLPSAENGNIAKVEFSGDRGNTWTQISARDGEYTARIVSGNNLIRVTKDDGTSAYQVVRGDKVEVTVENMTDPGNELEAGDTARVRFDDVHFPAGKMAGIYNPGFGSGHKITYTYNGETVKTPKVYQYNFVSNSYIDVVIPDDAQAGDTYSLTDGYIAFNIMGASNPLADDRNHRSLTDAGITANLGAGSTEHVRSILPNITLAVGGDVVGGDGGEDAGSGGVIIPDDSDVKEDIDVSDIVFDIDEDDIKGYVMMSFEDLGERVSGETGVIYDKALGVIIDEVPVPFKARDTIAQVTLRLLDALDIEYSHAGTPTSNFYLSSIGDFSLDGEYYDTFGEFDAGAGSGWMVAYNDWYINRGASEFFVEDGDIIEWRYTCRLGADIGSDDDNPTAEITGLEFADDYGTLSPEFDPDIEVYTLTVSQSTDSIALRAILDNYRSQVTYSSDGETYKPMHEIPVAAGVSVKITSEYCENAGGEPFDTDVIVINIKKKSATGSTYVPLPSVPGDDEDDEEKNSTQPDEPDVTDKEAENDKDIPTDSSFNDVGSDDWFVDAVTYVVNAGMMNGVGEAYFAPNAEMTRAMLVTVLYRLDGATPAGESEFDDVEKGEWYYDAVAWAAEKGIVKGMDENTFAPSVIVTREQMAAIFYRYAAYKGYAVEERADLSVYNDEQSIGEWAYDALSWSNANGIIEGIDGSVLSPKTSATRAQVATVLMRFCEKYAK